MCEVAAVGSGAPFADPFYFPLILIALSTEHLTALIEAVVSHAELYTVFTKPKTSELGVNSHEHSRFAEIVVGWLGNSISRLSRDVPQIQNAEDIYCIQTVIETKILTPMTIGILLIEKKLHFFWVLS